MHAIVFCRNTEDHLMQVPGWMRPPAPARGSVHISLRGWNVFVVDRWSGAESSHAQVLRIASIASRTRGEEIWRQR